MKILEQPASAKNFTKFICKNFSGGKLQGQKNTRSSLSSEDIWNEEGKTGLDNAQNKLRKLS